MRSIRWVVVCVLAATGCGEDVALLTSSGEQITTDSSLGSSRLRLMAANLTSGSGQNYSLGHGTRILAGVRPDVAMMQEFKVGSNRPEDFRAMVDQVCGSECTYARGSRGNIPNGVISRYPILASGDWVDSLVGDRAFTWARIDIPGDKDLWAVSVHLLTTGASNRRSEAQALVNNIKATVPSGDYVVIAGDFNTSSRTEAALSTLSSVVVTSGPWPTDRNGNGNTNANRGKPYDWVVVSPELAALQKPTVVGGSSFPNGLVADTRVYNPISELAPAYRDDSGAPSMQHMGVVRDFELVGATPTVKKALQLAAPNGGERLVAGTSTLVTWTSEGIDRINIDFPADGTTFEPIASGVDAATGSIGWTVPEEVTSSGMVRISGVVDSVMVDTSDEPFSVELPKPVTVPAQVIINEVLANEPGSSIAGEFIELYNAGGTAADLSGWSLSDSVAVRHLFASGTSLAPGATLVVFGSGTGIPPGVTALGASTGQLGLSNGGDAVVLKNASAAVADSITYNATLSSLDGVSMNRSPDRSAGAPLVLHNSLTTQSSSPGRAVTGAP